uniref:Uncharacterized LOC108249358 n=1 Tax=Kryptolebias marmoratus TaxID=37003 RepID=A0A3Q3AG62_KRYMA
EMVALHCPPRPGAEAAPSWTGPSGNLTGSLSASADVLIHGHSLVFLAVSVNHQGNYSCFPGNAGSRFWFQVVVSTAQSGEHEGSRYLTTCFTQESCRLSCPAEDIPAEDTPSITSRGVTWRREGEASSARSFFPSVEEEDGGVYVCSRSYSYGRHVYNSSFTVVLDVQPSKQQRRSEILSPKQNDVFPVDLGSTVVIGCEAVVSSDFDEVFWLSETSFVDEDASLPLRPQPAALTNPPGSFRMEGRPAEELHLQAGVRPSELHLHHRHPQPKRCRTPTRFSFFRAERKANEKSYFFLLKAPRGAKTELLTRAELAKRLAHPARLFLSAPSASRLHPLHLILPFGCIAALLIVLAAAVVTKSKPDAACRPRGAPGSSGGGPGPGSRLLNRAAPVEDHIC